MHVISFRLALGDYIQYIERPRCKISYGNAANNIEKCA
jgi:hypothetical protein